jgi:hypothetical protein
MTLAVTLAGCGGAAVDDSAGPQHSGSPSARPSETATASTSPTPSVPPGDPGPDAPGTDDPNGDLPGGDSTHATNGARTTVPRTAVLDAETVGSVVGGTWTASAAPADSCTAARPAKAVATRSAQFASAPGDSTGGTLVETVATHHGVKAAITAVHALERRLTQCHATSSADPRIGDAAVQLRLTNADGTVTVITAAAVEGVTFVLSGTGPVTSTDQWSSLTDIALGSTCAATIDGCH